jgi:hypothetical protein
LPVGPSSITPSAGPTAPSVAAKAPVPLRALFKSYGKEAQLSPATVKRWTPVLERLIGHLGLDDARAISRANLVAWKDALLAGGMKNITVRDVYLAATKALLQFAVDQGLLAENPAKEVKVRVKKKVKEREKGFDGDEAAKILTATLRPCSQLISAEMKAARRWLPWMVEVGLIRCGVVKARMRSAAIVQHDDGTPTGSRSTRDHTIRNHRLEKSILASASPGLR